MAATAQQNKVIGIAALATLLGALGGIFAFFDNLHEPYVTHDELELRILQLQNARLENELLNKAVERTAP